MGLVQLEVTPQVQIVQVVLATGVPMTVTHAIRMEIASAATKQLTSGP